MTYGHAERTLAAIYALEAETRDLLSSLGQLSTEQAQWLHDTAAQAADEHIVHCGTGVEVNVPAVVEQFALGDHLSLAP